MEHFSHQITHNLRVKVGYKSDLENLRSKIKDQDQFEKITTGDLFTQKIKITSSDLEDQDQRS